MRELALRVKSQLVEMSYVAWVAQLHLDPGPWC